MQNINGGRRLPHDKLLQALEECMNAQANLKNAATALEVGINVMLRSARNKRTRVSEVA